MSRSSLVQRLRRSRLRERGILSGAREAASGEKEIHYCARPIPHDRRNPRPALRLNGFHVESKGVQKVAKRDLFRPPDFEHCGKLGSFVHPVRRAHGMRSRVATHSPPTICSRIGFVCSCSSLPRIGFVCSFSFIHPSAFILHPSIKLGSFVQIHLPIPFRPSPGDRCDSIVFSGTIGKNFPTQDRRILPPPTAESIENRPILAISTTSGRAGSWAATPSTEARYRARLAASAARQETLRQEDDSHTHFTARRAADAASPGKRWYYPNYVQDLCAAVRSMTSYLTRQSV